MSWHAVDSSIEDPPLFITVGGRPMLIVRDGDDWLAAEDRCSHAGCAFSTDGEIDAVTAICNCHGSEFDLRTGAVQVPPARDPIQTFRTRVSDGRIEVEL